MSHIFSKSSTYLEGLWAATNSGAVLQVTVQLLKLLTLLQHLLQIWSLFNCWRGGNHHRHLMPMWIEFGESGPASYFYGHIKQSVTDPTSILWYISSDNLCYHMWIKIPELTLKARYVCLVAVTQKLQTSWESYNTSNSKNVRIFLSFSHSKVI